MEPIVCGLLTALVVTGYYIHKALLQVLTELKQLNMHSNAIRSHKEK